MSLDRDLITANSHVVGGAPGNGFYPLPGVSTLPVPESAVPDNCKVGNQVICLHSRCFGSHFDVNLFDVSSVFWLFFQANLILINHLHRPSLAKSEW